MDTTFDFRLIQLDGSLSHQVQSIWSASVAKTSTSVTKPLFSDGASGAFIILKGEIIYHGQTYQPGLHWIPVKKEAQFITLSAGIEMVGFRFQPTKSKHDFLVFHDESDVLCSEGSQDIQSQPPRVNTVSGLLALLLNTHQTDRLTCLWEWLQQNIQPDTANNVLLDFIRHIDHKAELQTIEKNIPLSLRQIERQFKSQIGFTPKYFQRLMRIRVAINLIRQCPTMNLVDLATEAGFSDQAHMNREFRTLAGMTPKEYQVSKQ